MKFDNVIKSTKKKQTIYEMLVWVCPLSSLSILFVNNIHQFVIVIGMMAIISVWSMYKLTGIEQRLIYYNSLVSINDQR
jgi:uncharacterized MnhB-related membrane protein